MKNNKVIAKAPTRIDLGGGIDHRVISMLCQKNDLVTLNIAIQLYTHVKLESYREGHVLVCSESVGEKELNILKPRFNDEFGLISAIINYFGVDGLRIQIKHDYPSISGLGGSSSLAVALISAIIKALELKQKKISGYGPKDVVWIAHSIEDSLLKNTGMQDQVAACYGGVNVWNWRYNNHQDLYERKPVGKPMIDFVEHSILVYSGCSHYLSRKGSKMTYSFINKDGGVNFVEKVNKNTQQFLSALPNGDLQEMMKCLNKEEILRQKFLGYKVPTDAAKVIKLAREFGCGVKFVGGGGGGCLWILGEKNNLDYLSLEIVKIKEAEILPILIDNQGVQVRTEPTDKYE